MESAQLLGHNFCYISFLFPKSWKINESNHFDFRYDENVLTHVSLLCKISCILPDGDHAILRLSIKIIEVLGVQVQKVVHRLRLRHVWSLYLLMSIEMCLMLLVFRMLLVCFIVSLITLVLLIHLPTHLLIILVITVIEVLVLLHVIAPHFWAHSLTVLVRTVWVLLEVVVIFTVWIIDWFAPSILIIVWSLLVDVIIAIVMVHVLTHTLLILAIIWFRLEPSIISAFLTWVT